MSFNQSDGAVGGIFNRESYGSQNDSQLFEPGVYATASGRQDNALNAKTYQQFKDEAPQDIAQASEAIEMALQYIIREKPGQGYPFYTLINQMRDAFMDHNPSLLEPLSLVVDTVYKRIGSGQQQVHETYEEDEIYMALNNLIANTIGHLEVPQTVNNDTIKMVRYFVNPIVETAGSLIGIIGDWFEPAAKHISDNVFNYFNPRFQEAIERYPEIKAEVMGYLISLPTIEKIYLGDSLIQVIDYVYQNAPLLIDIICQSGSLAKMISEFGVGILENVTRSIHSFSTLLSNIQGLSFNILVFTIILAQQVYEKDDPGTIEANLRELCVTYAGRALYNLDRTLAETEHSQAVAREYGNLIYHALMASTEIVKQLHLAGYAANPYLMIGFIAYAVGMYINSFHSEPIPISQAFMDTYRNVFGDNLPDKIERLSHTVNKLIREADEEMTKLKAEAEAAGQAEEVAQILAGLINNTKENTGFTRDEADAAKAEVVAAQAHLEQAAINAAHHADLVQYNNRAGPAHNEQGFNTQPGVQEYDGMNFGGGKARRRKTKKSHKKKHTKKAHKGKSKKAYKGKRTKGKMGRKNKSKGKKHTKRRVHRGGAHNQNHV